MNKTTRQKCESALSLMKEDSQASMVLRYMLEHGSITPKEAEKKPIYSMRLGARIWDLKHIHKIPVEKEMLYKKRGKKSIPHAVYFIGD